MKTSHPHLIAIGHFGNPLERVADEVIEGNTCEHKPYCVMPKYSMKCVFAQNTCQAKKYYDSMEMLN